MGDLQERFQPRGYLPVYEEVAAVGPSHSRFFTMKVMVDGKEATGQGSNKKEAKSKAAQAMLDLLDGKRSSSSVQRQVSSGVAPAPRQTSSGASPLYRQASEAGSDSASSNFVGELQEFCVAKKIAVPRYEIKTQSGPSHAPEFVFICNVGPHQTEGVGKTKQVAKNLSAAGMVQLLREASGQGSASSISRSPTPTSFKSTVSSLNFGSSGPSASALPPASLIRTSSTPRPDRASPATSSGTMNSPGKTFKAEKHSEADLSHMEDFFLKLEASESEEMGKLKSFKFSNDGNGAKDLLLDVARAENFSVDFVEVAHRELFGNPRVLLQLKLNGSPVFVAWGSGPDLESAKNSAAVGALEYIKIMSNEE